MNLPFSRMLAALAACGIGATFLIGCGAAGHSVAPALPAPSPTPTPLINPAAPLSSYLAIASPDADTRTYSTTTTTQNLKGDTSVATGAYTQRGGTLFSGGATGKTTTVTLAARGLETVSKQEQVDGAGRVTGYQYFTEDSNGCTLYGSDLLDSSTGQVSVSDRFDPPVTYRYNVTPGQDQSAMTDLTRTNYDGRTNTVVVVNKTGAIFELRFVGIESVTVPAGTFTAARVTLDFIYPNPAGGINPYERIATIDTAAGVGVVKSVTPRSAGVGDSYTSSLETDLLTAATIGGVRYGR